ncbi:MAG: DUF1800 domain-containing protein [Saprospiraceae bacterium]|nr:DUF1800 domain-containing protein [Saprospiraceae bacterium]
MDRHEFFRQLRESRNDSAQALPPTSSLDPYTGPWTPSQAIHLLRRTCFGAPPADVKRLVSMTMQQAVDSLLQLDAIPAPPLNIYSTAQAPDPDVPYGQTFVNAPFNAALPAEYYTARINVFKAWWMGNIIQQKSTISEKMTLFWHNHFATEADTVLYGQASYFYYKLLRENCLGNIKSLALKVSKDPAMLRYLNGYVNSKTAPDENYARELMELFTLGKGPDSRYTEDDVKAAAKILTGYRINPLSSPISYFFLFTEHDTGNKKFSSFFNNATITGKLLNAGENELDELITMLFNQTETARHLCRKLYQFFVYYDITPEIETNVIIPLAEDLKNANYNILPVLQKLFRSQHFYDYLSIGCVIKNPIDYAVGMIREMKVSLPSSAQLVDQYLSWGLVTILAAYQGLNIADPPVVSGWQAWYQAPQFHEIWINADTLANRNKVADNITSPNGIEYLTINLKIDPTLFASQLTNPYSASELVSESVLYLYNYTLSNQSLDYLKSFLISGLPDESYWTQIWTAYIVDPTDPVSKNAAVTRLNALYREIISQAEYHLS